MDRLIAFESDLARLKQEHGSTFAILRDVIGREAFMRYCFRLAFITEFDLTDDDYKTIDYLINIGFSTDL
jgi:hypothetical protein